MKLNWVYSLIVLVIYIPLVFMGANVFFPEYSGSDRYYVSDCFSLRGEMMMDGPEKECVKANEEERRAFENEKRSYEAGKYVFITLVNLLALFVVIFIGLDSSILLGLFSGSIITTFISTMIYFDTRSKLGFSILVLIFIGTIYYINKKKARLF